MTIRPDDFYQFAEDIMDLGRRNKREIYYRNMASRAYYSSLHRCRNFLVTTNRFQISKDNSHQQVINALRQQELDDLADLLFHSRELRTLADYELENTLTERDAYQALRYAQEVADRLNVL